MKKYVVFFVFVFVTAVFTIEALPSNQSVAQFDQDFDIVIMVHPGGWGIEYAQDLAPVVQGIEETLTQWGYKTVVVPYERTADGVWGKVTGIKKLIQSFSGQADILAQDVEVFVQEHPGKKVVMAGLSNGAAFTDSIMTQLSEQSKERVFAIELGVPFQKAREESKQILRLDNYGSDTLSQGRVIDMVVALVQGIGSWVSSLGSESLAQAIQVPGHAYSWAFVQPQVSAFLSKNITQ